MFSAMVVEKRKGCCSTVPITPRRKSLEYSLSSTPSRVILPAVYS